MRKMIMITLIMALCILPVVAADALQEKAQVMKQNAVKNMEKLGYSEEEIGQVMNKIAESKMTQEQKMNMYKWMTRLETKMEFKKMNESMENKIQAQNKVQNKFQNKAQPKPKYQNKKGSAGPNK